MFKNRQNGFTLMELLIVIFFVLLIVVGIWGFGVKTVVEGNFWFTEPGVNRELRISHPEVTEIRKVTRNVYSPSLIEVIEGGVSKRYLLDSDLLFNYEFSEAKKE